MKDSRIVCTIVFDPDENTLIVRDSDETEFALNLHSSEVDTLDAERIYYALLHDMSWVAPRSTVEPRYLTEKW